MPAMRGVLVAFPAAGSLARVAEVMVFRGSRDKVPWVTARWIHARMVDLCPFWDRSNV